MTDLSTNSPRRRRWVLAAVAATIVVAAAAAWFLWDWTSAPPSTAAGSKSGKPAQQSKSGFFGKRGGGFDVNRIQPVTAVAARVGNVNVVQSSIGTVTALKTATVRPRVDGLLQNVAFTEGQQVSAGSVLAQIDPAPFQVQLDQTEGQLARDAAQLANARLDLERYRKLLAQDSIASQQVDQQAALVRQLEGTVKFDEAQVANAKLQLSWTRITAPIGGRLGLRLVDPGNMVRQADTTGLAVITQVDPITVVYTIPQDVLPRVMANLGADRKMEVEAWDREQKTLLATGVLITADNQIDVSTGTVKLKAQYANAKGLLYPNQFVNVRMVIDVRRDSVVVPTAAVQRNAQGQMIVYVVKDDSTATIRPVGIGPAEGTNTAIERGLAAGELVVTDGVDRIREGAKVEVIPTGGAQRAPGDGKGDASKDERRKRFEAMTPEQREAFKKKMESMTPEQREEFRKRREAEKSGK